MPHNNTTLPPDEALDRIWELADKIDFCMFTTWNGEQQASRPMSARVKREENAIYFLTSVETGKVDELARFPNVSLGFADNANHSYVVIAGKADVSNDRAKIEELWSPFDKAFWGKCGRSDHPAGDRHPRGCRALGRTERPHRKREDALRRGDRGYSRHGRQRQGLDVGRLCDGGSTADPVHRHKCRRQGPHHAYLDLATGEVVWQYELLPRAAHRSATPLMANSTSRSWLAVRVRSSRATRPGWFPSSCPN
jgi:Uncharacterized stress protein (general stress protein 26)